MKDIRIVRISSHPDHGTFGCWVLEGQPMAVTLEPYKRDNAKNVSCIPSGQYILKRVKSPKYGDTFEVTNIEGRDKVLIHWGNLDDHTEGCILLGESFNLLNNNWAVLSSRVAFKEFMKAIGRSRKLRLTITEVF